MKKPLSTSTWILVMTLGACGDPTTTCPEDFPVERDGFCYRADAGVGEGVDADAADASSDVGSQDGGAEDVNPALDSGTADVGPPDTRTPDAGTPDAGCSGTHPLVEGERRYCAPGDCYCATPDSCHSAPTAAACCEVDVVCD